MLKNSPNFTTIIYTETKTLNDMKKKTNIAIAIAALALIIILIAGTLLIPVFF